MNKKGFSLVELMAVIVLIGLIAALASIPINKAIKDYRKKLYERQIDQIVLAANDWVVDNPYLLPPYIESNSVHLTIEDLINAEKLDTKVVDSRNKKEISSCSYVEITLNEEVLDANKNIYKYQFYEVENC